MVIRSSTKESVLLSLENGTRMYIEEDIENRIGTIAIMVSRSVDKELDKSSIKLNINKSNESFNLISVNSLGVESKGLILTISEINPSSFSPEAKF